MPIPVSFDIDRTMTDIHWLAEELGPRPYRGSGAQKAAIEWRKRLKKAGWKVQSVHEKDNIIACKGDGRRLILAHLDSVENSPGAVDNAAAAATLLEVARTSTAENYCVGFTTGEEVGMVGSKQLAQFMSKWHPSPESLDLVISLELTGHGRLWWSGLGKEWGDEQLEWLAANSSIPSQFAYQVVSRIFPTMERSDHRSFQGRGPLTALLVGRNKDGIYPHYHQADDDVSKINRDAILKLGETVNQLILADKAPAPLPKNKRNTALMRQGWFVPSWVILLLNTLGIATGLSQYSQAKASLIAILKGFGVLGILIAVTAALAKTNLFHPTTAEITAQFTMGIDATGWWTAAAFVVPISLITLFVVRFWLKPQGSAAFIAMLFCIPLMFIDPLLSAPLALSCILGYFWGPLAIVGALFWIYPGILRELSFHGVLSPIGWLIPMVFLIPAMGLGQWTWNRPQKKNTEKKDG